MQKIILIISISLLFVTSFLTTNVFALQFDAIHMVSAESETEPVTTFGLNETPWLYLLLPESGLNYSTDAFWESPVGDIYLTQGVSFDQAIWYSLDSGGDSNGDPISWTDVREAGKWNINAFFSMAGGPLGGDTTSFKVVSDNYMVIPEPMTLTLVITGGAGVFISRLFWNKR